MMQFWDLNCIAGHLLLSPQRLKEKQQQEGWTLAALLTCTLHSHGTMTFHGGVPAGRYMSHIHTQHDAAVPSCLTYRRDERARRGHVMRSDPGGVSGRYFSEEKICVSGYQPVRWAAAVLPELQHEQCRDSQQQQQQQQTAVLWASSYVIGPGGTGAFTCTPARARHTQLVTTGAITRLQPVL